MCNGEMKIHPKVEREEERGAQCILKRPPAAYKPIAAYQGAGPGELDLALTICTIKEESLKSTVYECSRENGLACNAISGKIFLFLIILSIV